MKHLKTETFSLQQKAGNLWYENTAVVFYWRTWFSEANVIDIYLSWGWIYNLSWGFLSAILACWRREKFSWCRESKTNFWAAFNYSRPIYGQRYAYVL